MIKKIVFLFLLCSIGINAQTNSELFLEANKAYKEGNYTKAINLYNTIEKSEETASSVYYNLGNCHYKLNHVANSIYNYEKALRLDPLNEDAKNNLTFSKRMTIDVIEVLPTSFLQKIDIIVLQRLSYSQWAWLSIIASFIAAILFLLYYFSDSSNKKRMYFIGSSLAFIILIASVFITFKQYNFTKNNIFAIIFSDKVEVKNAPTLSSDLIFKLHEGTRVKILDTVDNWKKIKLTDGKIGWIVESELKEI